MTTPDPAPYSDRWTFGWHCPACGQKWSGARDGHACPTPTKTVGHTHSHTLPCHPRCRAWGS